jgi:hypothetical protein
MGWRVKRNGFSRTESRPVSRHGQDNFREILRETAMTTLSTPDEFRIS